MPAANTETHVVGEVSGENQDEIGDHPKAESAEGEELKESGSEFLDVEAVKTEDAEKQAKNGNRESAEPRLTATHEVEGKG